MGIFSLYWTFQIGFIPQSNRKKPQSPEANEQSLSENLLIYVNELATKQSLR